MQNVFRDRGECEEMKILSQEQLKDYKQLLRDRGYSTPESITNVAVSDYQLEIINGFEKKVQMAYWERNQLLRYITFLFPSWLETHPIEDKTWEDDWRHIVFVHFPEGKYSWHIHDDEMEFFVHLDIREGNSWDGSTTEEKYRILRNEKTY